MRAAAKATAGRARTAELYAPAPRGKRERTLQTRRRIGTRGPGEQKLETDRRRIRERVAKISRAIEAIRKQRSLRRQTRQAVPLGTVALVGYTNAGKSTLFNALSRAGVLVSSKMFATLDPTVRAVRLPSNRRVLLSDTVGFIRDLPPGLITAFSRHSGRSARVGAASPGDGHLESAPHRAGRRSGENSKRIGRGGPAATARAEQN